MLGKRSRPLIKKLSDCPMNHRPSDIMNNLSSSNTNNSTRSPPDFRIPLSRSPVPSKSKNNNLKCSYNDHVAGVGLGIIIAGLENSNSKFKAKSDSGDKILVKYALRSPSPAVRSGPIPVKSSGRTSFCVNQFMRERGVVTEKDPGAVEDQEDDDDEEEEDENYIFVTCRSGPNKANVTTRVYYGGGDHQPKKKNTTSTVISSSSKFKNSTDYLVVATQKQNGGVFRISSAFGGEEDEDFDKAVESTCSDFLNNCNMCRKTLLGKDIFMYRGEKAFCSEECRQRQMARDERKESKFCRSEAEAPAPANTSSSSSRATINTTDVVLSGSPYHNYYDRAQIFSAGIVAV